jgi:hypothetical protein
MAVEDGMLLEGQLGPGPFARFETPIEQGSTASQKAQNRTLVHPQTAWHSGTRRAFEDFEGQLVVAPSAPELPASEGEQAAAEASLSRAPPLAMATAGVGGYII